MKNNLLTTDGFEIRPKHTIKHIDIAIKERIFGQQNSYKILIVKFNLQCLSVYHLILFFHTLQMSCCVK